MAILSTGDEMVEPGEALAPGKIYDSNAVALAGAVRLAGAEPLVLPIARDAREALLRRVDDGLRADLLVSSAGVSMGDRDLVRSALSELGVEQVFWKIDMKPGHPTAFGVRGATPVVCLPGNPVSALVGFDQLVRPALRKMMGHRALFRPSARATLLDAVARRAGRTQFVSVRLERQGAGLAAWCAGGLETWMLSSLLRADGLAVIPPEWGAVAPGTAVEVQVLRPGFDAPVE